MGRGPGIQHEFSCLLLDDVDMGLSQSIGIGVVPLFGGSPHLFFPEEAAQVAVYNLAATV